MRRGLPLQNFGDCKWFLFLDREEIVASATILCDGFATLTLMTVVMAPEATWEIFMTQMVWIGAPGDFHLGKHIPGVDVL